MTLLLSGTALADVKSKEALPTDTKAADFMYVCTNNRSIFDCKKYVYDDFGKIKLVDLVKSDIKEFYTSLNKEKHLAISTIDAVHTCLIQVIQFAVDDGLIRDNPANFAMKDLKRKKIIEQENILAKFLGLEIWMK